jgi:ribosomal protein S18 acetylase RimI-like enzyme
MKIQLRPIQPKDEEFLFIVYASTRTEEMALVDWGENQKESFLRMQFYAQQQSYLVQYPQAQYSMIEYGGRPIGRMIVNHSANDTFLVDIALIPDFRNRGLGTSLLHNLQAEGKKITLHVIRTNPAVNLYQRLGFVFVGEEGVYSQMEWSPAAARTFPWPGLRIPLYRPASAGAWSLRKAKKVAQFGYFQDWEGGGDIDVLTCGEQTWMTSAHDEVDSQAPHVAAAFGHTLVMGAGMGIVLYNLLSKKEVSCVTLVERDPLVIDLLRQATGLEQWRGLSKLHIKIADARDYVPDVQVDHLYADIWAAPGEPQSIPDMQRIQSNVRSHQVGWWGQELLYLDWLNGREPTLENYRDWADQIRLPLIEQANPAYPSAVAQVSKSYCYRMFRRNSSHARPVMHLVA